MRASSWIWRTSVDPGNVVQKGIGHGSPQISLVPCFVGTLSDDVEVLDVQRRIGFYHHIPFHKMPYFLDYG